MRIPPWRIGERKISSRSFQIVRTQGEPPTQGNNAMSPPLQQISCSPFFEVIEGSDMPRRFVKPIFTNYDGKSNPMEHVSHYNQSMVINSKNKTLICKIFPSSLGPIAMRWFDGLEKGSIHNYDKLTQPFGARFVTCN